ncbi:MAG TPA: FAD-binding oxidoreductase, partial [bacterium]|nr:FAD-binding oxidoreductase [bacterium]
MELNPQARTGNGERSVGTRRGGDAARRRALVQELRRIVGDAHVLVEDADVIVYEQDGSILQAMPEIVVLPADVAQISEVIRAARRDGLPIVPRGSGTGLAGGAVPAGGGVVVSLARLNRLLGVDYRDRTAELEPGVINLEVTKGVAKAGFFYAPDPSSQAA